MWCNLFISKILNQFCTNSIYTSVVFSILQEVYNVSLSEKNISSSVSFCFTYAHMFLLGLTTRLAVGSCIVTHSCYFGPLTPTKMAAIFTITQISDFSHTGAILSACIG